MNQIVLTDKLEFYIIFLGVLINFSALNQLISNRYLIQMFCFYFVFQFSALSKDSIFTMLDFSFSLDLFNLLCPD